MYKLFAFLFFTSITTVIVFMFAGKDLPIGAFVILNILIYIGFIFFVAISSFFRAKYSFSEISYIRSLNQKLEKFRVPLTFIGSTLSIIYVLMILIIASAGFIVFAYPVFSDVISKQTAKTQPASNYDSAGITKRMDRLESGLADIGKSLFYINNKNKYISGDPNYEFEFRVTDVKAISNYYKVGYYLLFCNKEDPKPNCLNTSEDSINIVRKINSFNVTHKNLKVMEDIPVFIMKLEDDDIEAYRIFYIDNIRDSSSMYSTLDPRNDLKVTMAEILSISADEENSALKIKYLNSEDDEIIVTLQFFTDTDGNIKYTPQFSKNPGAAG